MIGRTLASFVLLASVCFAPTAHARDWFVRAGASGGDGTREKPFSDPWQALERVEANDRVHVAAGRYFGKLEAGNWVIPFPGVELLGGYDQSFAERDPWKNVTELAWRRGSVNRPHVSLTRISTDPSRDTAGAAIDGFLMDMQDTYEYGGGSLTTINRNGAVSLAKGTTLRNCIILNSVEAVRTSPGVIVENNLILNSALLAIRASGGGNDDPVVVIRNNTIVFSWDPRVPGRGGTAGHGIDATSAVHVENNLIVHADNFAVSIANAGRSTFSGNVFYRNLYANLRFWLGSKESALDDTDLHSAEEIGLAKTGGNMVADPGLPFDATWYEVFLRRTVGLGKRFDAAAWDETRKAAGLAPTKEKAQVFAPAYPAQNLAALMTPKNTAVKAGARMRSLAVAFGPLAAPPLPRSYARTTLEAIAKSAPSFDGKAVEVIAGKVGVTTPNGLSDVNETTHKACFLADVKGNGRMYGYFRKGTTAERTIDGTPLYGSGQPKDLFVVRGIARVVAGTPRYGIVIDSIERYEEAVVTSERPPGRDWFVRAGESDGDGSREKPLRDPYQALEKAAKGDRIHVTEGEYGGKLKSGKWVIDKPWIALLGGYDRDFKMRDPWQRPSVLLWPADSKTKGQGYLLEGSGDHTGLLLDGFVFDRRTLNSYKPDGNMNVGGSDDSEHLWVSSQQSVIRNCTFVNGAGGAVRMSAGVLLEHNIIVNVWHHGIVVQDSGFSAPAVIRNNTIMFVWERRFHDGSSSSGSGINLKAAAILEGNVIQYADNFGVKADVRVSDVLLTGNTFFRNWAVLRSTQGMPPPTIDEKGIGMLADLAFKRAEGNVVANADFAVDPVFYSRWFARTSVNTSRFSADEWKAIAPRTEGEPVKEGLSPAYDYRKAATLVPRNSAVKGGARPRKIDVVFGN